VKKIAVMNPTTFTPRTSNQRAFFFYHTEHKPPYSAIRDKGTDILVTKQNKKRKKEKKLQ
jgi:hypothetical protein